MTGLPLLLYCLAESSVDTRLMGIGGVQVESLEEGGLRCFYSTVSELPVADAGAFRERALEFHAVLQAALQLGTVIPFRFPTLLQTEDELRQYLGSHAAARLAELQRLRGRVQMEVRIRPDTPLPQSPSGADYMRAKAEQRRALDVHAVAVSDAVRELVHEWRMRNDIHGLRCFALIGWEQVAAFEQRVRSLSPVVGAAIIVSGPWPPTEFTDVRNS